MSTRLAATKKKSAKKATAKNPARMKAFATFDLYLADQPPPQQRPIRALPKLVAHTAPSRQAGAPWGKAQRFSAAFSFAACSACSAASSIWTS
ncbi:MAG: hypothetical protein R3F29_11520 [Planctomycetota bacterium]